MTGQAAHNIERIRELAGVGMTRKEIAAALGLCGSYVSVLAKQGSVPTGRKWSRAIDVIRRLASQGFSRQEIADEVGISYGYVASIGNEHGIAFVRKTNANKKQKPDFREVQMLALYKSGKTLNEIGQEFGITRERVRQLLTKFFGVRWRDGGKHKQAVEKRSKFEARRNQRSLARWGCSWDDYAKLRALKKPTRAFSSQRRNARKRGIEWHLTLWQWWSIWQQSGHWQERGRGQGYVMCRVKDEGAYAPGNVFIALAAENSSEQKRKKSGLPRGVVKIARYSGYHAFRNINGKRYRIGHFPTPELAHAAYLAFCAPSSTQDETKAAA
jgi:DNA-binding CsgD family transcriptional regulator